MKWILVIAVLLMGSVHAYAQQDEKYVTSNVGILCVRFSDVREAVQAASAGDTNWLKSLGCSRVEAGIPVLKLDELKSTSDLNPWKVRITLPNGEGASVWGPVFAFKRVPASP